MALSSSSKAFALCRAPSSSASIKPSLACTTADLLQRRSPTLGLIMLNVRSNYETSAPPLFSQLALTSTVSQNMETVHGKKYIIDDTIETPSGKSPVVRTVWIIDRGEDAPRLVTAYPHEE
jgi:hypothetical protein